MVVQLSTTPSPTTRPPIRNHTKLEPTFSVEQSTTSSSPSRLRRWSTHRCPPITFSISRCLPVSMEATKALAQKWKRKSSSLSLRRSSSNRSTKKEAKAAAEEYRAQVAREAFVQQEAARRETIKAASTTTSPAPAPNSPPVIKVTPTTDLDAALLPKASPDSDISPTTQAPPNPTKGDAEPESSPASPSADYFTLNQLTGASPPPDSAPPGKISFSIPQKVEGVNGTAHQDQPDSNNDSDVAVSSATPSTVVSPRGSVSVDDGATDAGRSSIASFNGGGSRKSSISSPISLFFRLPNGILPQGRPRGSITSRQGESSPSIQQTESR